MDGTAAATLIELEGITKVYGSGAAEVRALRGVEQGGEAVRRIQVDGDVAADGQTH